MSTCLSKKYPLKVYFIFYYGKIIGLCPLSLKNDNKMDKFHISQKGMCYSIFLCVIYTILFYKNIVFRFKIIFTIESIVSAFWDRFLQNFQYSVVIVSWMNFGFRQKKFKKVIDNFNKIGEIARNIGIERDNFEIIRLITINTILISILYIILWLVEIYINSFFDFKKLTLWTINSLFRIVYHNMIFFFISILNIIYRHYRLLNIRLKYLIVFHESSEENSSR